MTCCLLNSSARIICGQQSLSGGEGILNVQPSKVVYVDIRSSTRPLFLPSCGGSEQDGYSLCQGAAFLEIRRGKNWERAKPPKGMLATLGTENSSEWKWISIGTSSSGRFVFAFTPELLGVSAGAQVRITVDAWTDQNSLKQDGSHITFTSPTFVCP